MTLAPHMRPIVLLVVAAMSLDLVTFVIGVGRVGIAAELNPVMARGYAEFGLWVVIVFKIAASVAILAAMLRVRRPHLRVLTTVFAASIPLLVVLGNVTTTVLAR